MEDRLKNFKSIRRYILLILTKNKKKIFFTFFIMLITCILDLSIPQVTKLILDNAIISGKVTFLIKLILLYAIISICSSILNLILEYLYSKIKKSVSIKLKLKLLKHLSNLSGNYYTEIKTGDLLRVLENDLYTIENCSIDLFFSLIINIITALVAIFFLIQMQLDLFFFIIILQIIILYFQSKFTNNISSKTKEIRQDAGKISNLLQEYISNIMNVVITKSGFYLLKKYIKNEKSFINKCIKLDVTISSSVAIANILNDIIVLSILGYGGYKIIKGDMTIGELIAFQQYSGMLMGPCMNIIRSNTKIQQTVVSLNRVYEILDIPIIIKQNNNGINFKNNFFNNIIFNNVNFSYDNKNKIIENLNMKIEQGKITALVGKSGCGKSTISKLLYRLWDTDYGCIYINNKLIQEYNLKSLRKNIAIITQDLLLYNDSLLNNLTLGNKGLQKDYITKICNAVGLLDLINDLPNGFNTIVGEKGVKLSGGQKQRISIARALLSNSNIVIFDEATSSLDNISQYEVLKNIKKLLISKTLIVIAHRLSTIKDADKIFVINEGQVVEEGTHNELILKRNYYYSLLDEQNN